MLGWIKDAQSIEKFKNAAGAVQSVAAVIAIVVGGIWTYDLFIKQRKGVPQANVSHAVSFKQVSDTQVWVHVAVHFENTGETILRLVDGEARVQQILPLAADIAGAMTRNRDPVAAGKRVTPWPTLCYRQTPLDIEIEPSETDTIFYEFFIPHQIRTIKVYSYFATENSGGRRLGWTGTSIHDVLAKERLENAQNSSPRPGAGVRICSSG